MAQATPQMVPGRYATSAGALGTPAAPSMTPPASATTAAGGNGMAGATAVSAAGGIGEAAPTTLPDEVSVGVSAWNNTKRITGLWSINQNRNSWIYVDGVGWKKLANNSDSAIVALSILSAHAREKNATVNYRDESDGMIHEMYVF